MKKFTFDVTRTIEQQVSVFAESLMDAHNKVDQRFVGDTDFSTKLVREQPAFYKVKRIIERLCGEDEFGDANWKYETGDDLGQYDSVEEAKSIADGEVFEDLYFYDTGYGVLVAYTNYFGIRRTKFVIAPASPE